MSDSEDTVYSDNEFHFRLTMEPLPDILFLYSTFGDVFNILNMDLTAIHASWEDKDKKGKPVTPHYHIYLRADGTISTTVKQWYFNFNKNLASFIPDIGNHSIRLVRKTTANMLAYINKQGHILLSDGISEEEAAEAQKIKDEFDKSTTKSVDVYKYIMQASDVHIDNMLDIVKLINTFYSDKELNPPQTQVMKQHIIYYLDQQKYYITMMKLYNLPNENFT